MMDDRTTWNSRIRQEPSSPFLSHSTYTELATATYDSPVNHVLSIKRRRRQPGMYTTTTPKRLVATPFLTMFLVLLLATYYSRTCAFTMNPTSRSFKTPKLSYHLSSTISSLSTTQLHMATGSKTGAKLIATAEDFSVSVLREDASSEEEKKASKPVMVFYTAPWCGPCRLSIPVVKDIMKQYSGQIDTVEICTDDCPEVAADANVVSIPTIQMYYKGDLMDTVVGCVAKSVLASVVDKVLEDANANAPKTSEEGGEVNNEKDSDSEED